MDYLKALVADYEETVDSLGESGPQSRLEYLSEHFFNFTTYDRDVSVLFAKKAVEVCVAITGRTTFEYIKDGENYRWFIIMCNMPFFAPKIEWGTSIRGAWWVEGISIEDYVIWRTFSADQWVLLMSAVSVFAAAGPINH